MRILVGLALLAIVPLSGCELFTAPPKLTCEPGHWLTQDKGDETFTRTAGIDTTSAKIMGMTISFYVKEKCWRS